MTRATEIIVQACHLHGVSHADLCGPSRTAHLVKARRYAASRLKAECSLSLAVIGRLLGHRDHKTAFNLIHGSPRATGRRAA